MIFVGQHVPYEIGSATVAVPGVPAGAHYLWQRWGRLPWATVTAPGREASYGTPFSAMHAHVLPGLPRRCVSGRVLRSTSVRTAPTCKPGIRCAILIITGPTSSCCGIHARSITVRTPMRWSIAVSDGGALSQEDLDAYRVIESTPRSVRVNDFTVHARGNDLDDLLGTMERVAPVVREGSDE